MDELGAGIKDVYSSEMILQTLLRQMLFVSLLDVLQKKERFYRIAGGIYCYPRKLNLTGDHALNWLGVSTQVPCNAVYWTDGTARRINVGKGRGILFKHSTSMDNFVYRSELMQLIVLAIREIGVGKI